MDGRHPCHICAIDLYSLPPSHLLYHTQLILLVAEGVVLCLICIVYIWVLSSQVGAGTRNVCRSTHTRMHARTHTHTRTLMHQARVTGVSGAARAGPRCCPGPMRPAAEATSSSVVHPS